MKKKLLIVLTMMLCLVTALSGCGRASFKRSIEDPYKAIPVLQNQTAVSLFTGEDISVSHRTSVDGKYIIFSASGVEVGATNQVLFDVEQGTIVLSYSRPDTEASFTANRIGFLQNFDKTYGYYTTASYYTVSLTEGAELDSYVTTFYNLDGTSITSATDEEEAPEFYMLGTSLVVEDEVFNYVTKKDKSSFVKNTSFHEFKPVPSVNIETEKYLYAMNEDLKTVTVYDQKLEKKGVYEFPVVDEYNCFEILENGDILVQGVNVLPDTEKEYSYVREGEKFQLVTEVYDVKKDKVKEVETEYIIEDVVNKTMDDDGNEANVGLSLIELYDGKYDNVVSAYKIENKRVDIDSDIPTKIYSMDNDGEISDDLPHAIENQYFVVSGETMGKVNNRTAYNMANRFYAVERFADDDDMLIHIVDKEGKDLGVVNYVRNNQDYFLIDGKIYDNNLTAMFDYARDIENKYTLLGLGAHSVYLNLTTETTPSQHYYRYYNGQLTEIINFAGAEAQFYLTASEDSYTLCNEAGSILITSTTPISTAYVAKDFSKAVVYNDHSAYVLMP